MVSDFWNDARLFPYMNQDRLMRKILKRFTALRQRQENQEVKMSAFLDNLYAERELRKNKSLLKNNYNIDVDKLAISIYEILSKLNKRSEIDYLSSNNIIKANASKRIQ